MEKSPKRRKRRRSREKDKEKMGEGEERREEKKKRYVCLVDVPEIQRYFSIKSKNVCKPGII